MSDVHPENLVRLNPNDLAPLWLSVRIATVATMAIVTFGGPLALILARKFVGKGLLAGVLVLPLVMPPTVLGYYLLLAAGPARLGRGLVGEDVGDDDRLPLVGCGGCRDRRRVSAFLAARSGGDRRGGPRLGRRGQASGTPRAFGLPGGDTPPGLARRPPARSWRSFARLGDFGATLMVAGNIPGLTQTASMAIYDAVQVNDAALAGRLTLYISAISITALWLVQRTLPIGGPALSADDLLEVRLMHRVHDDLALDVAFRLGCECGVVFGPSGAGKTTLLRLIAGLARPDRGFVRLGDDVLCDTERRVDRAFGDAGSG